MQSPFNNWAKGLTPKDMPAEQGAIAGLFNEGTNFAGTDGAYFAQSRLGGPAVPIPGKVPGFSGLAQIGTSFFSMPGRSVTPGGEIIDTVDAAFNAMRAASESPNQIRGMKDASAQILEASRSSVSTSLGLDYTLAFNRSKMISAGMAPYTLPRMGKYGGRRTLGEHLSHMDELLTRYQTGGVQNLNENQAAVDKFYRSLVTAVEGSTIAGQTVSISGIKDKLFREHGVVSTMSASDMTYGVGLKGLGKGYHQFAKLQPFHSKALSMAGLQTPAASGLMFAEESAYASGLMGFEGVQSKGAYASRFGADTFLALGEYSNGRVSPSQVLADSRSIAGRRLHSLSSRGSGVQPMHKTVLLGGADKIDDLQFHPQLSEDIKSILRSHEGGLDVPKGMKRSSAGIYAYAAGPKTIRRQGYPGSDIGFFLGKSVPQVSGALDASDLRMSLVGAGDNQSMLKVLGYRMSSKGGNAIDIMYEPGRVSGSGNGFAERAMVINGRRVMQRQSGVSLATTAGNSVDQILRASELGVGSSLGDEFLGSVMSNWAHISRSRGKLGEFSSFMSGHRLMGGSGIDSYVGLTSNQAGVGGTLHGNIGRVVGASDAQLDRIGLSRAQAGILQRSGNQYSINPSALETMSVGGKTHLGLLLKGLDTSVRAGNVDAMRIGPGAVSMRLHDMIPMINEQWAGVDPSSQPTLYNAYKQFHSGVKSRILAGRRGRLGSLERGLPGASRELASIYQSYYGHSRPFSGGLLKGVKGAHRVMDYSSWLADGSAPLATTTEGVRQKLAGGASLSQGSLAGTVHATGYGGEVVKLPKAMKIALTPDHTISTSMIPLPTDRFLGSTPTQYGKFLTGSGFRNLGLPRKKAMLAAIMHEESSMIRSGNYSSKFTGAVRDYMSSMQAGMSAEKGLIYKNLAGQPSGSFDSIITNWGSIPTSMTREESLMAVGMNPTDARSLLRHAGYGKQSGQVVSRIMAGKEDVFLNVTRYPWHQGSNLGVMKLKVSNSIARDRIAVSDLFAQVAHGDFDKDRMVGMLMKDQQASLREIHTHRQKIMQSYDSIVQAKEKNQLSSIVKKLQSGELTSDLAIGASEADRAAITSKLATRLGSAAGGGAYVGPVHMGWARMNALTHGLMEKEGEHLISAISSVDSKLGEQLTALSKDKGFLSLMGTTQETGVYGILGKEGKGFGSKSMSALSGLAKYAEGGLSADKAREVLRTGFQNASDAGLFEMSEVAAHNVTSAGSMVDKLFPSGGAHEGVGTISKARAAMRRLGLPDVSYEMARGYDPTKAGGEALMTKRIADTAHALAGSGFPLTQGGPNMAEGLTSVWTDKVNEAAANAPSTLERVPSKTMPERASSVLDNVSNQFRGIMQTKWGKRVAVGAGVVLGLGAIDSMFGASGEETPAPQFVGPSPLPPRMDMHTDNSDMPSAESFAMKANGPARIERPIAQRSNYGISAMAGDSADFSYMAGVHQGSVGAPPTRDAHIVDSSRDIDLDYELRRRLRASF